MSRARAARDTGVVNTNAINPAAQSRFVLARQTKATTKFHRTAKTRQHRHSAMNLILVKMFATALALAQVTTRPESLKTEFDPVNDQAEVVQLLKDGCAHMRKAFDIEDLNLDALIETAMEDPQAVAGEIKAFRGINFDDLLIAYKQFCSNETVDSSPFDMKPVIEFYNKVAAEPARPQQAQEPQAARHQRRARRQGREVRRAVRVRSAPRLGAAQRRFPNTSSRRSSPPRTSASISTRASTSAA